MAVNAGTTTGHGSNGLPWLSFGLALVATGLYLLAGPAPEALVYGREEILQGDWWRLLSGHLVHSDVPHALWDILALGLSASILERRDRKRLCRAMLFSLLFLDAWLWWGVTDLDYYCGLSGVLNTLLTLVFWQLWRDNPHPLIVVAGLGYMGKLVVETVLDQALFTSTAWPGLPGIHMAGVTAAGMFLLFEHRRATQRAVRWCLDDPANARRIFTRPLSGSVQRCQSPEQVAPAMREDDQ
ncbi:rhombosortase [Sedimenticola hydrogenitrophicus]|uniref:rhombosortase n=1 Tax=Sedimenticola hydrogenitrophicus TaxID=2967975 RepID=UPI0023B0F861|nr:rhombosortase [Sedimenticola hydrogenitrophicus]